MLRSFVLLASVPLIGGCSDTCANDIVSRVPSPNGKLDAVLFQRDCGATTGFSTQVSVVEAETSANVSGNAFVANDDGGRARTGNWGGPWAETKWLAADHLFIRYASGAKVYQEREKIGEVKLSYEAIDK